MSATSGKTGKVRLQFTDWLLL